MQFPPIALQMNTKLCFWSSSGITELNLDKAVPIEFRREFPMSCC
jgi:hypothetical protein